MTSGSHVVYQRNKRVNDNPNLPREDGLLRGRKTRSKSQMLPSAFPSASFHFDIFVRTPFCLFPKERGSERERRRANRTNRINRKMPVSSYLSLIRPFPGLKGTFVCGLGAMKTSIDSSSDSERCCCAEERMRPTDRCYRSKDGEIGAVKKSFAATTNTAAICQFCPAE